MSNIPPPPPRPLTFSQVFWAVFWALIAHSFVAGAVWFLTTVD
jgi:hypothetical protein